MKANEILIQINNTSGHKTELLTYKEDIVEKNRITATYNKNTSQFSTENFLPMKNKLHSKSVKKVLDPFWGHTGKANNINVKNTRKQNNICTEGSHR